MAVDTSGKIITPSGQPTGGTVDVKTGQPLAPNAVSPDTGLPTPTQPGPDAGHSGPTSTDPNQSVIDSLSKLFGSDFGTTANSFMKLYGLAGTDNSPHGVSDLYNQISDKLGLSNIKGHYDSVLNEQDKLQNELQTKVDAVNNNPWISSGTRTEQLRQLQNEYTPRFKELTSRQSLYDGMYKSGVQQAQYLTTAAHNEQHQQSTLQTDAINKAIAYAEQQQNAANKSSTQITTADGQRVIVDKKTNKIVATLGASTAPKAGKTPTQVTTASMGDALAQAKAAIDKGAPAAAVRQRFLTKFPKNATNYDAFFKTSAAGGSALPPGVSTAPSNGGGILGTIGNEAGQLWNWLTHL